MPGQPKTNEYTDVNDEDTAFLSEAHSCENLLGGGQKQARRQSPWSPRLRCNAAGFLVLALSTILIILVTIKGTIWYERRGSNAPRWRPVFSPFYDMMGIQLFDTYIDSSSALNTSDPRDIYRLPPSPEVDAAWDRISEADGVFVMSEEEVIRAGKDPKMVVDAPASFGFPEGKTKMMGLDGLHQMHCLNVLRKGLIINYDYYWGSEYGFTPPLDFAHHLDHCLTVLRLHLMCHPDLEPFTFTWREGQIKPYADFEIRKSCINYDNIVEWRDKLQGPRHPELWRALYKPKGVLQKEAVLGLPKVTNETLRDANGEPVAWIPDFEGKQY